MTPEQAQFWLSIAALLAIFPGAFFMLIGCLWSNNPGRVLLAWFVYGYGALGGAIALRYLRW